MIALTQTLTVNLLKWNVIRDTSTTKKFGPAPPFYVISYSRRVHPIASPPGTTGSILLDQFTVHVDSLSEQYHHDGKEHTTELPSLLWPLVTSFGQVVHCHAQLFTTYATAPVCHASYTSIEAFRISQGQNLALLCQIFG